MIPSPTLFAHRPVVSRDRLDEQAVVRGPRNLGRFLAEPRALRGRVDEVGEQDRRGAGVRRGRLGGHRWLPTSFAPSGARNAAELELTGFPFPSRQAPADPQLLPIPQPLLVMDANLRVLSANRSFYRAFNVSEQATVGRSLHELGNHQWDIPQLRSVLGEVLPQQHVLNDLEVVHDFEGIGNRIMLLNARAIRRGGDRPDLILLAIEDITERTQIQDALRDAEASKICPSCTTCLCAHPAYTEPHF